MRETVTLLLANNKCADQPAHPRSLISAFIIRFLKNKVTGSDIFIFGGLQHDKFSGYAPEDTVIWMLSSAQSANDQRCIIVNLSKVLLLAGDESFRLSHFNK